MAYDAFISYSHGADGKLAPALQSALHRFAKPWWKLRAIEVFRDETSLAAAHDLSEAIRAALASSRFFILLASPGAARSKWVEREVRLWLAAKPVENILIVLTEGRIAWSEAARDFDWATTDALPQALAQAFAAEPLWVDLAWARSSEQLSRHDPRFQQAVARLAAPIHGKSLDQIAGEEVRQHRRTRRLARAAVSAIALLALAAGTGAWFGFAGQRRAERNLEQALQAADSLVTNARRYMSNVAGISIDLRMKMLGDAESVLKQLESSGDSIRARHSRASMLITIAENYRALGEFGRAEALVGEAVAILDRLVAARQGVPETEGDFAESHQVHGEILIARRRHRDAIGAYERSLAILAPFLAAHPRHARIEDWKLTRMRALNGLGDAHFALRDDRAGPCADAAACLAKAEALHAQALDIAANSSDDATKDFRWANGALVSQERLGRVYESGGDLGRSEMAYAAALAAIRRIVEAAPENSKWRVNLMAMHWRLGGLGEKRCDFLGASTHYGRSLAIAWSLHALDPKNTEWLSYLAQSLDKSARVHWAQGSADLALKNYRESAKQYQELMIRQPDHERWKAEHRAVEEAVARLERKDEGARPGACR